MAERVQVVGLVGCGFFWLDSGAAEEKRVALCCDLAVSLTVRQQLALRRIE